ncbi:hypothetical protein GUJ93_ZPchr0011g28480 [Zizania palustris]|uniref:Glycoside hydrolase family 5 domain-containing protein n=1 Tax=Zizania palustris TaxID=103762 RepID=A0A8J5WLZ1_ZIZPA|nr:hypothetical protein GUJ93_ZPchr0011g28480 [Zizania palustris]
MKRRYAVLGIHPIVFSVFLLGLLNSRLFSEVVSGAAMDHPWKDVRLGGMHRNFDWGEQCGRLASFVALLYFSICGVDIRHALPSIGGGASSRAASLPFVERRGARFFLDGRPFYLNGWNSYWLMDQAMELDTRHRVSRMFSAAAAMGLTVCRTWAFNDDAYNALQLSPGKFDERVFKALDRLVAEAAQHDVRLILSLANNLNAYGGKRRYVQWAWEEGVGLTGDGAKLTGQSRRGAVRGREEEDKQCKRIKNSKQQDDPMTDGCLDGEDKVNILAFVGEQSVDDAFDDNEESVSDEAVGEG